jgi:hypothetical protein
VQSMPMERLVRSLLRHARIHLTCNLVEAALLVFENTDSEGHGVTVFGWVVHSGSITMH